MKLKKSQLKEMMKPLIRECLREMILEEKGILSTIIREVKEATAPEAGNRKQAMLGKLEPQQVERLKEHSEYHTATSEHITDKIREAREAKARLAESIGGEAYSGIFENTEPLETAGNPDSPSGTGDNYGPLRGRDPSDAGIDLEGILEVAGGKKRWKRLTERK